MNDRSVSTSNVSPQAARPKTYMQPYFSPAAPPSFNAHFADSPFHRVPAAHSRTTAHPLNLLSRWSLITLLYSQAQIMSGIVILRSTKATHQTGLQGDCLHCLLCRTTQMISPSNLCLPRRRCLFPGPLTLKSFNYSNFNIHRTNSCNICSVSVILRSRAKQVG